MYRGAFFLLLLLLTGCSYKESKVSPLSKEQKSELKKLVTHKSAEFQEAISEAIDTIEITDGNQMIGTFAQDALFELFFNSDSDTFSSDEQYEKLKSVISDPEVEKKNLFAAGLSKYLTDKDYACKEPLYNKYFDERYNGNKTTYSCHEKVPFNVLSRQGTGKLLWLDPKRVSSIHILFAGNGDGIISRFGHISMRLVVCPEGNMNEEACNTNLYEHLVIGYRAHINELKISTFKGLMGDYRAYLFANDFMDIYQEYAIGEFREIFSLPLKLEEEEIEEMVRAMSQIHWSFSGDYKFLTQNCSSLMQKALFEIWDDFKNERSMDEVYWRPDNFFTELRNSDLVESYRLNDLGKAEEEGYYFPSMGPVYNKAMMVVEEAMERPYFRSIDEYVRTDPELRYALTMLDKAYKKRLEKERYLFEAQLLLEELAIIRSEAEMMAEMTYYFNENNLEEINNHMKKELNSVEYEVFSQCIVKPIVALTEPIKKRDGIPLNKEETLSGKLLCDTSKPKSILNKIKTVFEEIDPENWDAVKRATAYWTESMDNVKKYNRLRGAM